MDVLKCEENLNELQEENNSLREAAINSLVTSYDELDLENAWFQNITIGKSFINFKLDSGSDVNVLPASIFRQINCSSNYRLDFTNVVLLPYGANEENKTKIIPVGKVYLKCINSNNNESAIIEFVVINEKLRPILGLKSCIKLKLIKRVHCIETIPKTTTDKF